MNPKDYICDLNPYQVSPPLKHVARTHGLNTGDIVQLASNENPLGPSPKVREAIERASADVHRYPDQFDLVQILASHCNVPPDMIALGNGSNDILDMIARVFLGEGDEAISSQYSFAVYQIASRTAGARNVVVPARDYGLDLPAMLRAITPATKVIWLDNPGNPTGTFVPMNEVKRFLEQVPPHIIVVHDEAYREYLAPENQADTTAWIAEHPNLVVVRTFSKMYGLAGLRMGYGVAAPAIIELCNRVRHPFNVNVLSLVAAKAAIADDDFVRKSYEMNGAGKAQLLKGLEKLGYESIPAFGNFVTVNVGDAAKNAQMLMQKGVITRPLIGYKLPGHLRVSIGTPEQNERFLAALGELV